MTRIVSTSAVVATLVPVVFNIYKLYDRDVSRINRDTHETEIIHKKGDVNFNTMIECTLQRDPKTETVKDTIDRLKKMFDFSEGLRYRLVSAKETDEERLARYEREGKEVVREDVPIIKAVDDEDIGIKIDSGKPIAIKKKATKKMAEAA